MPSRRAQEEGWVKIWKRLEKTPTTFPSTESGGPNDPSYAAARHSGHRRVQHLRVRAQEADQWTWPTASWGPNTPHAPDAVIASGRLLQGLTRHLSHRSVGGRSVRPLFWKNMLATLAAHFHPSPQEHTAHYQYERVSGQLSQVPCTGKDSILPLGRLPCINVVDSSTGGRRPPSRETVFTGQGKAQNEAATPVPSPAAKSKIFSEARKIRNHPILKTSSLPEGHMFARHISDVHCYLLPSSCADAREGKVGRRHFVPTASNAPFTL